MYICISPFSSFFDYSRKPFDSRYSRGTFLAFEIAVSIRNVMERGLSYSFSPLPFSFTPRCISRRMARFTDRDSIERDRESRYFKEIYDRPPPGTRTKRRVSTFFSPSPSSRSNSGHGCVPSKDGNFCSCKFAVVPKDLNRRSHSVHGTF